MTHGRSHVARWPSRGSRALRVLILLALILGVCAPSAAGEAISTPPSTEMTELTETSHLHLIKSHGLILNERGVATGTFPCRLAIRFKIVSATRGEATLTAYLQGGSITGHARASYILEGSTGHFAGSFSITKGTGSFAHVTGNGLRLEGTINPTTLGLSAQLTGQVHL